MRTILTNTYWLILLIVSVLQVFNFRKFDLASRIICLWIWLGLVTEGLGYFVALKLRNNYPVYNPSLIIEFILISLYFNYAIPALRKKCVGICIAIIGSILGILNIEFVQPIKTFSSNFMFLECLVIMCFCHYSIYRMLIEDDEPLELSKKVHFWIPVMLLFYQCANLSIWGLYDKFTDNIDESVVILDFSMLVVNICTYTAFGVLFYFLSKKKLSDVF